MINIFVSGYNSNIDINRRGVEKKVWKFKDEYNLYDDLDATEYTFNYCNQEFRVLKGNRIKQPMFEQSLDQLVGFLVFKLKWSFDRAIYSLNNVNIGFDLLNNIDHYSMKEVRDFIVDNIDENNSDMNNVNKFKEKVKEFNSIKKIK